MGRRLTEKEKDQREVKKALFRILGIQKQYGLSVTRRACNQFYIKTGEKLKLEKEIKQREQELQRLKNQK